MSDEKERFASQYFTAKDHVRVGAVLRAARLAQGHGTVALCREVGIASSVLSKFEGATQRLFRPSDCSGLDSICDKLKVAAPVWEEASIFKQRSDARKRVLRRKSFPGTVGLKKRKTRVESQVVVKLPEPQEDLGNDSLLAVLVLYKRGVLEEKAVLEIIKRYKS